jgi:hypothetical protein
MAKPVTMSVTRWSSLMCGVHSVLLVTSLAAAEEPRSEPGGTGTAVPASASPVGEAQAPPAAALPGDEISSQLREAQERYVRAVKLYDERAFDAALLEFRRAYELAPTFRILYNLGVVSLELRDYANALAFFERYLSEGKAAVPPEAQAEVAGKIRDLLGRVAFVSVVVNVPGAEVSVDDRVIGVAPFSAPLRLNTGSRRISARAAGRIPDSRVIDLTGGDTTRVELNLVNPAAQIRVHREADKPSRPIPWLGWGATAALSGFAVVSGMQALAAQRSYERRQDDLGVTRDELDSVSAKALHYSLAADALAVAALAVGGYSLYLTLRPLEAERDPRVRATGKLELLVTPGGGVVRRTF